MKAERLGGSCADHFPDVDSHAQTQQLEFVDQCDVHAAVDVFKQLGHLRDGRRRNRNCAIKNGSVERAGKFGSSRIQSADHFGNIAASHGSVSRIFAFGRESDEKFVGSDFRSPCGFQAGFVLFFENRYHHFFGGAGISGALENDELSSAQVRRNGVCSISDEAEIRFVIFVQRSGDADDDGVHFGDLRVVRGRGKALRLRRLDFFGGDAIDVGSALGEGIDFALVNVEARHLELLLAVKQRERKSDIAHSNDANQGLALLNLVFQLFHRGIRGRSRHCLIGRLFFEIEGEGSKPEPPFGSQPKPYLLRTPPVCTTTLGVVKRDDGRTTLWRVFYERRRRNRRIQLPGNRGAELL